MRAINYLSIPALALVVATPAGSAEPDPLFQSSDALAITLTAPFRQIDRERDKDTEYKNATMSYIDLNGEQHVFDVELEVRGNNRLKKEVCSYSQLWVNLKKKQVEGTLFENQDKIKLVVQCRNSDRYADYIIKEQQAYQIFNQLTDYSFKTRLVQATYVDSARNNQSRTHVAFFIEHLDRLAERVGMENVGLNSITVAELDAQQGILVNMFMYMISNTDFSIIRGTPDEECCHNSKLLESTAGGYIPVPYDFDSSGFVDASYAEPAEQLGQRNVRQRVYRGFCVSSDVMEGALAGFHNVQDVIGEIVRDAAFVDSSIAARSMDYISDFYQLIADPEKLQSRIIDKCRG